VDTYDEPGTDRRVALRQISKIAERLPHHRPLGHDELLRVDVASALRLTLPRRVIAELEQFLAWYSRLNAAFYPRARAIEGHARRFLSVHPPDTDVPLLDLYHDVFEPREASRPSAFPSPSGSDERADQARQTFVRVRERMAAEALEADREGRDEVALDEWDWRSILGESPEPPWSCGALFQIAATGTEAIDAGDYRLILNGLYAGGGLAMARLAHLHAGDGPVEEGPIAREIRAGWSWLERDDAVVAEVSYMHGGRTANAGLRPSLFRYEIELPGDRATPSREVIPLTELVVRFDSASRRFRLIWRGRGLDVMPVIASGISPEGFIAFLVAVGQQDLQPLALFPGFHVEGIPRWPRFRFGQVVLFRRRWVFPVCETPMAAALGPMDSRRAFDAACWRRIHGLPRHLFAHTNAEPKPFYVDLESPWLLERLVRELSEHPETDLHLTEMLPGPDELWVRDARGRYASEFLVHLGNLPERSRS